MQGRLQQPEMATDVPRRDQRPFSDLLSAPFHGLTLPFIKQQDRQQSSKLARTATMENTTTIPLPPSSTRLTDDSAMVQHGHDAASTKTSLMSDTERRRQRALRGTQHQQSRLAAEQERLKNMLRRRPDLAVEPSVVANCTDTKRLGAGSFACVWVTSSMPLGRGASLLRTSSKSQQSILRPTTPSADYGLSFDTQSTGLNGASRLRCSSLSPMASRAAATAVQAPPRVCLKVLQLPMGIKESRFWPSGEQSKYRSLSALPEKQLDVSVWHGLVGH